MLLPPTLGEVLKWGEEIDLPETESTKFFLHYQSNGWKVGKNPMKCARSALAGWKLRWQEREQTRSREPVSLGLQVHAIEKTLESHPGNPEGRTSGQATLEEREEFRALKKKLAELYRLIAKMRR